MKPASSLVLAITALAVAIAPTIADAKATSSRSRTAQIVEGGKKQHILGLLVASGAATGAGIYLLVRDAIKGAPVTTTAAPAVNSPVVLQVYNVLTTPTTSN